MFTQRILSSTFVFTLILSGALCSTAYADLTQQILQEIANGTRTIRAEIKSLKTIPAPEPSNLSTFVINKQKAIELGKALFWDMQVGVDGIQACASCHFNAGADNRTKNTLSPGLLVSDQFNNPIPDFIFSSGKGVNYPMRVNDFPFHVKTDPILFNSRVLQDSNDVISSQGVHFSLFTRNRPVTAPDPDGFQINGINTRRVVARNAPTVINAVFNHRQFWDGRASNIFNGVDSFGDNNPNAVIYEIKKGSFPFFNSLKSVRISIDNASLASQAMAPPVSDSEMSSRRQNWLDIGDRFIANDFEQIGFGTPVEFGVRPLANQKVHPQDSVLGPLSTGGTRNGLRVGDYAAMITRAFDPKWWDSNDYVWVKPDGSRIIIDLPFYTNAVSTGTNRLIGNVYSQMEMNFSLFFGLAVQLYQSTLIADNSPVDRYLDGNPTALTQSELVGFHIADAEGRCLNCHGQGEFTFAAVSRIKKKGLTRIRRGDLIDEGFNNIGVRSTLEDLGVGGVDPFGNPLGFARRTHLGLFDNDKIPGTADELAADLGDDGAFKIPTLRNVELTAPYFHNGGNSTLEDVIDFYFRGGNFRTFNLVEKHPIIGYDAERFNESKITGLGILRGPLLNSGPGLDDVDKANLVAFLKALTDERVRYRKAPFDHPQLFVPNGHPGDHEGTVDDGTGNAIDELVEIPAVGAAGSTPLPTFAEKLLP